MKTELDYDGGMSKLPDGAFKISPSAFNTFITAPHRWYREQVLGEGDFKGNTATVIGTLVHYVAEKFAKHETIDKKELEKYIIKMGELEDVDMDDVRNSYKEMAEALVNRYVKHNMPAVIEDFITYYMGDGVWVAGTVDAYDHSTVVDYKTYNSKSRPKRIPMNYKYQLLIYAYIYRKLGRLVDRIRLVYVSKPIIGEISEKTGKQLKSYPSEVTVLTEEITDEDMEFIESVLLLCKETYLKSQEDPSLTHLLYKDYRLKEV